MSDFELHTFRISHFSEKIRWCLDASGIEYQETRWTPVFHALTALRLGRRGTTLPILCTPEGCIQDSTRIFHWLAQRMPAVGVIPPEGPLRDEAFALEAVFDRMGEAVLVRCYAAVLDDSTAMLHLWTPDASPRQPRVLKRLLPLLRPGIRAWFKMNPAGLKAADRAIEEALDLLDQRLASLQGDYLVGDRLSFADITACALLGPLFGPPQHPMWSDPVVHAMFEPIARRWRDRPAVAWVLERYAKDRGAWRNPPVNFPQTTDRPGVQNAQG